MQGFHFGHQRTRSYTTEYYRFYARSVKKLIEAPLGKYQISGDGISGDFTTFRLLEHPELGRGMVFKIKGQTVPVPISRDQSSVSTKHYITCPYCANRKQHLYIMPYGLACRGCANLHYPAQSERKMDRLSRTISKKRAELWGTEDYSGPISESSAWREKPKWMRWKTYHTKLFKLQDLEYEYNVLWIAMAKAHIGEYKLPSDDQSS